MKKIIFVAFVLLAAVSVGFGKGKADCGYMCTNTLNIEMSSCGEDLQCQQNAQQNASDCLNKCDKQGKLR